MIIKDWICLWLVAGTLVYFQLLMSLTLITMANNKKNLKLFFILLICGPIAWMMTLIGMISSLLEEYNNY